MACIISFVSALAISFVITYLIGFEKKETAKADAESVYGISEQIA